MYPYGASARSGHFVCELCAQNVLLTVPGMNVQHFRHDPASPNKECDERQASFDPNYGRSLRALNSHINALRSSNHMFLRKNSLSGYLYLSVWALANSYWAS